MTAAKLPALDTAERAYGDAVAVVRTIPGLVILCAILQLLIPLLQDWLVLPIVAMMAGGVPLPVGVLLLGVGLGLLSALVVTPLQIAIHRLLLRGERPSGLLAPFASPRFLRFYIILSFLQTLLIPLGLLPKDTLTMLVVTIVAGIGYSWFYLRIWLVFPHVAVSDEGESIRAAIRLSRGNVWRLLGVALLVLVGPALIIAVATFLFVLGWIPGPVMLAIKALSAIAIAVLGAAAAASAYRVLTAPEATPAAC